MDLGETVGKFLFSATFPNRARPPGGGSGRRRLQREGCSAGIAKVGSVDKGQYKKNLQPDLVLQEYAGGLGRCPRSEVQTIGGQSVHCPVHMFGGLGTRYA